VRQTALDLPLTLFVGIPVDLWFTLCAASGLGGGRMREAFLDIYHLGIVTIMEGEDEIEVVAPADGFLSLWVDWSLFVVTPSAACLGGCEQSSFP